MMNTKTNKLYQELRLLKQNVRFLKIATYSVLTLDLLGAGILILLNSQEYFMF